MRINRIFKLKFVVPFILAVMLITGCSKSPAVNNLTYKEGLTDFSSISPSLIEVDESKYTVTVESNGDNHLVLYDGLETAAKDFMLEADVRILASDEENTQCAALLFGVESKKTPTWKWYGANIDTSRQENPDLFRLFGPEIDTNSGGEMGDIDIEAPLHLKLEVAANGDFTYSFGNAGSEELRSINGTIPNWMGGYVGILTYRTRAEFSNIKFEDRTVSNKFSVATSKNDAFKTDFESMTAYDGVWEIREKGLYSNSDNQGNTYLYSKKKGNNFVYSADITFLQNTGTASLLFRSSDDKSLKNGYVFSIDGGSNICRLARRQDGCTYPLTDDREIKPASNGKYELKVVAIDSWISCYVNDVLIASTGDYVLQPGDKGQSTFLSEGYFGLQNLGGEMIFQNAVITEINDSFTPLIKNITVSSSAGTVEESSQYIPTNPVIIQYVKNNAKTVNIEPSAIDKNAKVTVQDENGNIYADGKQIPVKEGSNVLSVISTATGDAGTTASVTYRVNVYRRQADDKYYKEAYRDQYHYSVKDGWANDPNGLVYFNGTYHLFYQFYTDNKWGPMHWAHATSKDLLSWEEKPIAFYPDANGAMFSGCIVADTENTSGLFSTDKGGLVALITADGNGQRIKIAYSEDEGTTWTKLDKIAADWTDDPLCTQDFRDPKVFRWEGKWFMVVAGGPLRIYSSDNLLEWTCESTYADLHTECPDLYPLQAEDGTLKWVLSRGGRYYKTGDFKAVNDHWTFIPDEAYVSEDGIMNFGSDSYAAMTYYIQDFGTSKNPTLPEIIELNWMNTWEDYCNLVGETLHQNFNGTFNLNLKLGIITEDGIYKLTQMPIKAYRTLRNEKEAVILEDVKISKHNTLLSDFSGDCYEIVSTFTPAKGTKEVGFCLRTGKKEETLVIYNLKTETLSINRSNSGVIISDKFAEVNSQSVSKNADGTIDLHIFVDRASVEVFSKNYTVAGANQIFPDASSLGLEVLVKGRAAKADIAVYPLENIWQ